MCYAATNFQCAGATMAAFLGDGGVRFSKLIQRLGIRVPEGIAADESASNAAVGACYAPLSVWDSRTVPPTPSESAIPWCKPSCPIRLCFSVIYLTKKQSLELNPKVTVSPSLGRMPTSFLVISCISTRIVISWTDT